MAGLAVTTLEGDDRMLQEEVLREHAEKLRGRLIVEDDGEYEEARRIYNAMIDRRPAMIARCADVADVIASVNLARDKDLLVAVRGGGHNGPGLSLCDGGVVIDLSAQRGVHVDPRARTVTVEGGALWGDVDHATHAFGLATVSGIISTTGVGGLTLGGGHGHLSRRYGLTIDNLLSADVVLADGSFVTASENEHPDLFWALRGGGGNFGIVTSFEYRLHPVDTVVGGPMMWSLDDAAEIMRAYREFLPAAEEDLNAFFMFMDVPPQPPFPPEIQGATVCGIVLCHLGTEAEAHAATEPLRAARAPLFEHLGPIPYPALQSFLDGLYPPGLQWYWKGDFVKEITDEAIDRHLQYASSLPSLHSTMHLYPIDGAVHRVGRNDTAFSYRDATWSEVIVGVHPDPGEVPRITKWAREYWQAVHPYSGYEGGYVNFMMGEGQERIRATYRDNYGRLLEVKRTYDPDNFFRMNQNIDPAG